MAIAITFFTLSSQASQVEFFVGTQHNSLTQQEDVDIPRGDSITSTGYIIGASFVRPIANEDLKATHHFFGMGVDIMDINGDTLIGLRPIHYFYQFHPRLRLGTFLGAATLDNSLPSIGYYLGVTATSHKLIGPFDLHLGIKHGIGLGRDKRSELGENRDPNLTTRPDIFFDFVTGFVALQYSF